MGYALPVCVLDSAWKSTLSLLVIVLCKDINVEFLRLQISLESLKESFRSTNRKFLF